MILGETEKAALVKLGQHGSHMHAPIIGTMIVRIRRALTGLLECQHCCMILCEFFVKLGFIKSDVGPACRVYQKLAIIATTRSNDVNQWQNAQDVGSIFNCELNIVPTVLLSRQFSRVSM